MFFFVLIFACGVCPGQLLIAVEKTKTPVEEHGELTKIEYEFRVHVNLPLKNVPQNLGHFQFAHFANAFFVLIFACGVCTVQLLVATV